MIWWVSTSLFKVQPLDFHTANFTLNKLLLIFDTFLYKTTLDGQEIEEFQGHVLAKLENQVYLVLISRHTLCE